VTTTKLSRRTAKDPAAYVALFAADPYWRTALTVELVSIEPGMTKSGRYRFTIRITDHRLEGGTR
jgi:hypothetical protein